MKYIQSKINNLGVSEENLKKYEELCEAFFDLMGMEQLLKSKSSVSINAQTVAQIEKQIEQSGKNGIDRKNSKKQVNITQLYFSSRRNDLRRNFIVWRKNKSKNWKTVDQVRSFAAQVLSISKPNDLSLTDAGNQSFAYDCEEVISVFHCACLDVAEVARSLVCHIPVKEDMESSNSMKFLQKAIMNLFTMLRGVITDILNRDSQNIDS